MKINVTLDECSPLSFSYNPALPIGKGIIKMWALNQTSRTTLADDLILANTLWSRMKGLLGKKALVYGEGLWIKPCKGVHTFGMRFPIDVVFLDLQLNVIAITNSLQPNRLTRLFINAASVMELPSGAVEQTNTAIGDCISIKLPSIHPGLRGVKPVTQQ